MTLRYNKSDYVLLLSSCFSSLQQYEFREFRKTRLCFNDVEFEAGKSDDEILLRAFLP